MNLGGGFWRLFIVLSLVGLPFAALAKEKYVDQDLHITFGGFVEKHPEGGKLGGVCGPDIKRDVLTCDIYNGLLDWTVTEIILAVTWSPYSDDDKRYYRVRVSIKPLKTEHVSVRLGMQLPPDTAIGTNTSRHWSWLIANARGYPVK